MTKWTNYLHFMAKLSVMIFIFTVNNLYFLLFLKKHVLYIEIISFLFLLKIKNNFFNIECANLFYENFVYNHGWWYYFQYADS